VVNASPLLQISSTLWRLGIYIGRAPPNCAAGLFHLVLHLRSIWS